MPRTVAAIPFSSWRSAEPVPDSVFMSTRSWTLDVKLETRETRPISPSTDITAMFSLMPSKEPRLIFTVLLYGSGLTETTSATMYW
ncbi:hypothetical protein D3C75_1027220 [compost metagenome]